MNTLLWSSVVIIAYVYLFVTLIRSLWDPKPRPFIRLAKRHGLVRVLRYERERRRREKMTGVKFDPRTHGEDLPRAVGATDLEIQRAKRKGLA